MRKILLLTLLIVLTLSCKDKKSDSTKENELETQLEVTKTAKEVRYISARLGLVYRDKPKGVNLGKFEFNEEISISEHTNIFQEIENDGKIIKGEWLGVRLEGKNVYVFDGFLSNTKTQITIEDVKLFMGNVIWISEEFKNILEETKVLSKAYNCAFYSDIAYDEALYEESRLFGDKNFMEPNSFKINSHLKATDYSDGKSFKITHINSKTLIIEKENKKYIFTKSNIQKNPNYIVGGYDAASYDYFTKWFGKSSYIFKNENGTKNYNAEKIRYLDGDIIEINEKKYNIDKVEENTYFLSEIKVVWEDEIDFSTYKTGKKATLTKN